MEEGDNEQEKKVETNEMNDLDERKCFECGLQKNLWMCLYCNHIGCGCGEQDHCQQHFISTGHSYAKHLEEEYVWNFQSNTYVPMLAGKESYAKDDKLPEAILWYDSTAKARTTSENNTSSLNKLRDLLSNKSKPLEQYDMDKLKFSEHQRKKACFDCDSEQYLCICSICSHVGCNHLDRDHAYSHFILTGHHFAFDIKQKSVWNHDLGTYGHHELDITNDTGFDELSNEDEDGLRVKDMIYQARKTYERKDESLKESVQEVSRKIPQQDQGVQVVNNDLHQELEKTIEKLTLENEHQQKQLNQLEQDLDEKKLNDEELTKRCEALKVENQELKNRIIGLRTKKEKELTKFQQQINELNKELKDEKTMNIHLLKNQDDLNVQLQNKNEEINELKLQNENLMFHLDAPHKFESTGISKEELQTGQLGTYKPTTTPGRTRRRRP